MQKTCFKCNKLKELSEFYKHGKMADGHLNKCKECAKKDIHESRHYLHRNRVLSYDLERAKTQKRIENRSKHVKIWCNSHRKERLAQQKAYRAYKSGKIKKLPCFICGSEKTVAHHCDYDAPLDVVWLCQAHHKQAHAMFDKIYKEN